MRFTVIILAVLMLPSQGYAQSALARNDATVSVGWSGAEYDVPGGYDRWRGSLLLSVSGGRYWTDHLKTELEAGWNSRTDGEIYEDLTIGGLRTYGFSHHRAGDVRLSFAQSYQFGRNEWIHPFLGAGVDVVHRETRIDRPAQTRPSYGGPGQRPADVSVPSRHERETKTLAQPFIKGGWKLYASDRVYFLTEIKFGFAPDLKHAVWKLGLGFDF